MIHLKKTNEQHFTSDKNTDLILHKLKQCRKIQVKQISKKNPSL